jgi:hypothetical protein
MPPKRPILLVKHTRRVLGLHPYYQNFANFGDADGFRRQNPEGA